MICPKCGVDDQQKVLSTRRRSSDYILRRRECICGHKFNSVEIIGLNEKNMKVIEREMIKNCPPRSFEKIVHDMYLDIFDHYRWLQKKKAGGDAS